ncbi:MAG: TetR/AcrR family transcriptional regulator [Endomicrobiia bacterium]|nr:TetR/AcrR family transcriptional regulator [Endomicrobiia bacterium]
MKKTKNVSRAERSAARSAVTKEKTLAAAIKILNKKDYYASPVDEIARAADVAKGTIYLYYKSKDDLYFAVFFEILGRMRKVAESALVSSPAATSSETLFNFLGKISDTLAEHRNIFMALASELPMSKRVRDKLREKNHEVLEMLERVVAKGVKSGEFEKYPPRIVAAMFIALISGLAHRQFEHDIECQNIPHRMIFDIFLNGIKRRVSS